MTQMSADQMPLKKAFDFMRLLISNWKSPTHVIEPDSHHASSGLKGRATTAQGEALGVRRMNEP
jgi:hypothetical protein